MPHSSALEAATPASRPGLDSADWVPDEALQTQVWRRAARLAGSTGFSQSDTPDFSQELTLDVWQRLHKFDPQRASRKTFVNRVLDHGVASLARVVQSKRRRRKACTRKLAPAGQRQSASGGIPQDTACMVRKHVTRP
jgi:DNA-directed RNA polymerase specialized sigma24 family protein